MPVPTNHTLDSLLRQAGQLHSPPAVALEIVRLTAEPQVDAAAIRDCLEGDPALTAKLLRVVNSSVYGLSGEVSDLTQAIALMGVRPLKLLVLGFSVPTTLIDKIDTESLADYWTRTIVRSVAAKQIAQTQGAARGWAALADEALVASLLQGIGQLVLLTEIGDTYAAVLNKAKGIAAREPAIAAAEREALGFEHRELSVALLRSWKLPERLASAIELLDSAACAPERKGELSSVLELANLVTRLVVDRELAALPLLIERGERQCDLTRRQINTLVEVLQPRAVQLANALGVDLSPAADFHETLVLAHRQLAIASEGAAGRLLGAPATYEDLGDERLYNDLLANVQDLTRTVQDYLSAGKPGLMGVSPQISGHGARATVRRPHTQVIDPAMHRLMEITQEQVDSCRAERRPLSIAIVSVNDAGAEPIDQFRQDCVRTLPAGLLDDLVWEPLSGNLVAVLTPGHDRLDAVRLWTAAIKRFSETQFRADAGVAGASVLSKGFDTWSLIGAARRCLDAALNAGVGSVKSLEVY
ncbi:HDOD domain-containing protein [Botrimarina hoheduenensis]|uniref:HDOD domain protein n=1 Tax=Botrimarina hoheduenensis TaxID=2528000 RepID=A0A5C5WD25_9BACT|nr:HDOD domain-containing protein [Botrimarina hoheduenensis]TWT48838.1 HDOD domain protein [Botrimarina hoheduenensis]